MSAWSADVEAAPKDGTSVLFRHPEWECPAVMKFEGDGWMFAETALQDIDESLIDTDGVEWALLPS